MTPARVGPGRQPGLPVTPPAWAPGFYQGITVNTFDVRIYAIRHGRSHRRPFEVRWHAAGRARSRSFTTRGLADSYRAELVRAARHGLGFDPGTGEPVRWVTREAATTSWHEHAVAYAAMKLPQVSAHSRAGIADALATITPALTTPDTGRPPATVLRAALYRWAFSSVPHGTGPGPAAATALHWAERHCLPLARLEDPQVTRRALESLTLRLDGARAAAATITRKRAVFYNALGYAVELGLLASNPIDHLQWKAPRLHAQRTRGWSPATLRYRRSWPRSPGSARSSRRSSGACTALRCALPKPSPCAVMTATCPPAAGDG